MPTTFRVHCAEGSEWKPARLLTTCAGQVSYMIGAADETAGETAVVSDDYLYYVCTAEDKPNYLYIMSEEHVRLFAFKSRARLDAFVRTLTDHTTKNELAEEFRVTDAVPSDLDDHADVPEVPSDLDDRAADDPVRPRPELRTGHCRETTHRHPNRPAARAQNV